MPRTTKTDILARLGFHSASNILIDPSIQSAIPILIGVLLQEKQQKCFMIGIGLLGGQFTIEAELTQAGERV